MGEHKRLQKIRNILRPLGVRWGWEGKEGAVGAVGGR